MKQIVMLSAKTLLSFARIVKNSRFGSSLPSLSKGYSEIHILGNGPSLNSTLIGTGNIFNGKDCLCVNSFVTSEYYDLIKPKLYLLVDPIFWKNNSEKNFNDIRDRVYSLMALKTAWSMSLILPMTAKTFFDRAALLKDNPNIKICFYNPTPISGFKAVNHFLYKHSLGMPAAQNVLVAAIFLAINIGYRKIYIHGADHSWHEDLVLDENNVVCIKDRHFFDKTEQIPLTPWKKGDKTGSIWKMHEILMALAKMFEGYQILEEYAKCNNVQILNASKKTYIDAFKRCDING